MFPRISADPEVQAVYERARRGGCGHRLAEMIALKSPPGVQTQSRMAARLRAPDLRPEVEKFYSRKLKESGTNADGKVLLHQLERFPGDPEAWVSAATPIDDAKKICRRRGWGLECGNVKIKPVQTIEPREDGKPYRPADDLIDEEIRRIKREDPGTVATPAEEQQLREDLAKKYAGAWGEEE